MTLDPETYKAAVYWAEALARGTVPSAEDLADMQATFAAVADAGLRRRASDTREAATARQQRRRARLRGVPETEVPPPSPTRADAPASAPADAAPVTRVTTVTRDARDAGVTARDTALLGVTPPRFPPFPSPTPPTNNPLPSPPGRLVGGEATGSAEASDAADDGPPPIVGVVLEPPASVAVRWTIAINRGVTAAHGEQPAPLRHPAQLAATERLIALGVDEAWAAEWLYAEAAKSTARGIPGSLAAFERRLAAAWADEQAARTGGDWQPSDWARAAARGAAPAESEAARDARIRRLAERHVAGQAAAAGAAAVRRAPPPRVPPDPTRDAPRTPALQPVGDVLGTLTEFLPKRRASA